MLISSHGSKSGFSMVESAVSLFIAGLLLLVILFFLQTTLKYNKKIVNRVDSYIQYKNEYTEKAK